MLSVCFQRLLMPFFPPAAFHSFAVTTAPALFSASVTVGVSGWSKGVGPEARELRMGRCLPAFFPPAAFRSFAVATAPAFFSLLQRLRHRQALGAGQERESGQRPECCSGRWQ